MECCSHCRDAGDFYNEKLARKELKDFRKKGPIKSTRLLIDAISRIGVNGQKLLDVGGGVGAIQHELFENGLASATQVDASTAYLNIVAEEAERRGNSERITTHYGDFAEMADDLPNADIVTLDRVLCCYPYMEKMVHAAISKANKVCGLVYPRERWLAKASLWLINLYFRIKGSDFRLYLHSRQQVDRMFRNNGFTLQQINRTFIWHVDIYEKANR